MKKYGGKTQSEVAKFWGNISRQTIHRALKNWIDTQKKKTYGYEKRSEEKRAEFLKIISAESPKDLLYIDESGIDKIENYSYGLKVCDS